MEWLRAKARHKQGHQKCQEQHLSITPTSPCPTSSSTMIIIPVWNSSVCKGSSYVMLLGAQRKSPLLATSGHQHIRPCSSPRQGNITADAWQTVMTPAPISEIEKPRTKKTKHHISILRSIYFKYQVIRLKYTGYIKKKNGIQKIH